MGEEAPDEPLTLVAEDRGQHQEERDESVDRLAQHLSRVARAEQAEQQAELRRHEPEEAEGDRPADRRVTSDRVAHLAHDRAVIGPRRSPQSAIPTQNSSIAKGASSR
jgi:hypothetical protein